MKLTDKILKMKQDMSDFDKEVLTKLREIHETTSFVDDTNLYDGHIVGIDTAGDTISLDIIYEPLCYDGFDNEQYDYVNTTEENGIRTHIYKKHTTEEVSSNNTTTPTDNTTTENKVIVEHTAPTGDSMNNTLKLFALSVLGLGFALSKRKDLSNE